MDVHIELSRGVQRDVTETIGMNNVSVSNDTKPSLQDDVQEDITSRLEVRVILALLYATIFIIGILGNSVVVHVVLWRRHMQNVTNIFIANLAISDLMICLWAVPLTPISGFLDRWELGEALCRIFPMLLMTCVYVMTWTSLAIAVDRYFVIVHPFRPKMLARTAVLTILVIWILSMCVSSPMGIFHAVTREESTMYEGISEVVQNGSNATNDVSVANSTGNESSSVRIEEGKVIVSLMCEEVWLDPLHREIFSLGSLILQYLIPGSVIAFCYSAIFYTLKKKPTMKKQDKLEMKRKKRTNKMLVLMVLIFVVCWLPFNVIILLLDYNAEFAQWPYAYFVFFVGHVIAMSSAIYNPFLYGYMNEMFRKEFLELLPNGIRQKLSGGGGDAREGTKDGPVRLSRQDNREVAEMGEKEPLCAKTEVAAPAKGLTPTLLL